MASTSENRVQSLLLAILLFCFVCICNAESEDKEKRIVLTNDLDGGEFLTMNCKSDKEGDFGLHVLPPRGSHLFIFHDSTAIYCNWKWKNTFHQFNIFVQSRDSPKCTDKACFYQWRIFTSGPCLFNPISQKYDNCFKWN